MLLQSHHVVFYGPRPHRSRTPVLDLNLDPMGGTCVQNRSNLSYLAAEALDMSPADSTPPMSNITPKPTNRSLWAAPAEPPSLYSPPQSTTEYTQTINPISHHTTNYPILGHYRQNMTLTNTLTSPLYPQLTPNIWL